MINGKDIKYIFFIENVRIKDSDVAILKKMQENYNIHIAAVTDTAVISNYMVRSMKSCGGLKIILDKDNIVRFIGGSVSNDLLSIILNNEMKNEDK